MDSTPTGLADAAKCYTCLSSHQKMAAITYLMAIWAGVSPDPVALAQAAVPYTSIPVNTLRGIILFSTLSYLVPQGQAPVLLSISPSSRSFGFTGNMTITGTGFLSGGATVTVAGLTLGENTDFSEDSATQLTVIGARLSGIVVGTYDVTYTNINGTSTLHNALTVTSSVPTLTSIVPNSYSHLSPVNITFNGTNFTNDGSERLHIGARSINLSFGSTSIFVNSAQFILTAGYIGTFPFAVGVYDVFYVNSNGTSNTLVGGLTVT